MKKVTKVSDELPLHSEIDRIVASKKGEFLQPVDLGALATRRHPLARGLTNLLKAEQWAPSVLELSLIDDLPTSSAARLKIELMRLAVSRNDLGYIAEAVVICRHKTKVASEAESSSSQLDLLASQSSPMFSSEIIENLLVAFSNAERRTTPIQIALFKLLAHNSIRSRLDAHSRAKILKTFFDPKNRPRENAAKAQKALVAGLLKLKADYACLYTDRDLFRTVSTHLATHEKDHSKGKRKLFFDWLRETKEADLLLDEVSWKDLDVVERLSVIQRGIESGLENMFYERLIAPELVAPDAATLMKVAVATRNLARIAIESIEPEILMSLALPNSEPKKLRNDPSALLLHRASKISSALVDEADKLRSEAEKRVQVLLSELEDVRQARRTSEEQVGVLKNRITELESVVEFETTSRHTALQTELELARFETVKELCGVHRGLITAERLVSETPDEFSEVAGWALSALERLGVDLIGPPGSVVPRDLVLHESQSPKGTPVEIIQVGYMMRTSRTVIYPALAYPVAD